MRFLECPPDLGGAGYSEEARDFYQDPLHWLSGAFLDQAALPTHLVLFDVLEKVQYSRDHVFFYTQLVGFSVIKTLSCWSRTFPDFWKAMNSQGLQRYSTLTSLKGESEEISWSTRDEPRPWRKTYSLIFKEFLYCLLNARQNKFSFSLLVLFIIQHVKHEG